jgi:hypothetical protein
MPETKFIKRKKPNYIRAIILIVILILVLFLFYNMDNLISGFIEIKE